MSASNWDWDQCPKCQKIAEAKKQWLQDQVLEKIGAIVRKSPTVNAE